MWPRLINIAVGIWLIAAPAVMGYEGLAADHARVVGPIVASLACIAIWEATRSLRRVNLLVGLWMLLSPWLLEFPAIAAVNTCPCGGIVVGMSLLRGKLTHRLGGGWALRQPPARSRHAR
jgi:hypothetical protein